MSQNTNSWRSTYLAWLRENPRHAAILAAILAFASWLISNTIHDWASEKEKSLQSLEQSQEEFDRHKTNLLWQRNVDKALVRIEQRLPPPGDVPLTPAKKELMPELIQLQFLDIFVQDWSDLSEFAERLKRDADKSSDRAISKETTELAETVRTHYAAVRRLRDEAQVKIVGPGIGMIGLTDDQAREKLLLVRDYMARFRASSNTLALSNTALKLSSKERDRLKSSHTFYLSLANLLKIIALLLAGTGTIMEIASKAVEARSKTA
jgi:hypothetical protein